MKTRFFRSRSLEFFLKSPQDAKARGLFFDLALGVQAPVDPDSGMTLNLVHVEKILDRFESSAQGKTWSSETELLRNFESLLRTELAAFPEVQESWIEISRPEKSWSLKISEPSKIFETERQLVLEESASGLREKTTESSEGNILSEQRGNLKILRRRD